MQSGTGQQRRVDIDKLHCAELKYPTEARLTYNGSGRVNKLDQNKPIRRVLTELIDQVIADFAFERPIYDGDGRYAQQYDLLHEIADRHEYDEILVRIEDEESYVRKLIAVVSNLMS